MPITPLRATYKQNQYKLGRVGLAWSTETIAVPADVDPGDTCVVTIAWTGSTTVQRVQGVGGQWVAGPVATNGTGKIQQWYAVQVGGGAPATAGARTVTIYWSANVQDVGLYMQVFGNIAGKKVKTFSSNASLGAIGSQNRQSITGVNTYGHRITWVGACVAGGAMADHLGPKPGAITSASESTVWPGVRENFAPLSIASGQKMIGAFVTKLWPLNEPAAGVASNTKSHTFSWNMSPNVAVAGAAVAIAFDNKESDIIDNVRESYHESINGVYPKTHPYQDPGVSVRQIPSDIVAEQADRGFYPMALTSNEVSNGSSSDQADGRLIIVGMEHPIVNTATQRGQQLDAYGQCINYMSVRTEDPRYSAQAWSSTRGWYSQDPPGFGAARRVNQRIFNSPTFPNISAFNYVDNAGFSYTVVLQVGPNGRDSMNAAVAIPRSGVGYSIQSDCVWTSWANNTTIGTGLTINAYNTTLGGWCAAVAGASTGPGKVDAFAVGSDNNIWRRRFRNNAWSNWVSVGGANRGVPANKKAELQAVFTGNGRIVVFANGSSGTWMNWFDESASGTWTNLVTYNQSIKAAGDRNGNWHLFSTTSHLTSGTRYDGLKDGWIVRRSGDSGWAYQDHTGNNTQHIQGVPMAATCSQSGKVDFIVAPISRGNYRHYTYYPTAHTDGVGPTLPPTVRNFQTVVLYGTDGAFKNAQTLPKIWAGVTPTTDFAIMGLTAKSQSMGLNEQNNLSVHSGHSFYMSHAMKDGKVMVLSEHQTNNPLQPTCDHATAYIFDPATDSWQTINIPTSTGYTQVVNPFNNRVGGTDFSDLISLNNIVTNGTEEILAMVSSGYQHWDISEYGLYPAMCFFRKRTDGKWEISKQYTAAQIRATNTSAATDIWSVKAGTNGNYVDTHFSSEVAQFPRSKHVVFGHYLPVDNSKCGAISIVDPVTGQLKATYKFPAMRSILDTNASVVAQEDVNPLNYQPGDLWVAPREFECDPTSATDQERFTVVLDTYPYPPNPHAIQEFEYNATAGTITPTTHPFTVKMDNSKWDGARPEIQTHRYDSMGNMYVTCSYIYSLYPGACMAFFKKSAGERSYAAQATLTADWQNQKYGAQVVADYLISSPGNYSQVSFSHDVDTVNKRVYTTGLNGHMTTLKWDDNNLFQISGNLINITFPVGVNAVPSFLGTAITEAVVHNGRTSLKMTSTFNNTMAVQYGFTGMEPGRHYKATADFMCHTGHTPKKVEVRVDCWNANGSHIGASNTVGTITQTDSTSAWRTVETDFDVQGSATRVTLQYFVHTATAGQIHYVSNPRLYRLPFKRVNVVDLGVNELRKAYPQYLQVRKAGIDYQNQVMYMPAGQLALPGITGQPYDANNFPQVLPQWLTKINLRQLSTDPDNWTQGAVGWGVTT